MRAELAGKEREHESEDLCQACFQTQWKDMLVAYGVRERNLRMTRVLSTTVFLKHVVRWQQMVGPWGWVAGRRI